jgi:predicted esterase YcpF (UPF0227 family)
MAQLIFDESQLVNVAKAVITYNEYQKSNTVDKLVTSIKRRTQKALGDQLGGYLATSGWVASTYYLYNDVNNPVHAYVSVDASLFHDISLPDDKS